jgi:hypothetical protein
MIFTLSVMVPFGLVVYATWLAFGAVATARTGAINSTQHASLGHASLGHGSLGHGAAAERIATAPPGAAMRVAPTPSGSTLAFDQRWTSGDGNTIVAGTPTVGTSAHTGGSVIRVPVTLTNITDRDWSPLSTTFIGTLNRAQVAVSAEGDWVYKAPIAPHTSVTLTKVFVGGRGQFTLTVGTPHGVALFTGHV